MTGGVRDLGRRGELVVDDLADEVALEALHHRGDGNEEANADGDAHSSQYDEARRLLFSADEDFCKATNGGVEKGYGYMRVYDYSDPAHPVQIGRYRTPNSMDTTDPAGGDFSLHKARTPARSFLP